MYPYNIWHERISLFIIFQKGCREQENAAWLPCSKPHYPRRIYIFLQNMIKLFNTDPWWINNTIGHNKEALYRRLGRKLEQRLKKLDNWYNMIFPVQYIRKGKSSQKHRLVLWKYWRKNPFVRSWRTKRSQTWILFLMPLCVNFIDLYL